MILNYNFTEKYQKLTIIIYVGIPIFMIIMLSMVFAIYINRRAKIERIRKRVKYFEVGICRYIIDYRQKHG